MLNLSTHKFILNNAKLLRFICFLSDENSLTLDPQDADFIADLTRQEKLCLSEAQLEMIFKATSRATLNIDLESRRIEDAVEFVKNKFERIKAENDAKFFEMLLVELEDSERKLYKQANAEAVQYLASMFADGSSESELITLAKSVRDEVVKAVDKTQDNVHIQKYTDVLQCVRVAIKAPDDLENLKCLSSLKENLPDRACKPGVLVKAKIQRFIGAALAVVALISLAAFCVCMFAVAPLGLPITIGLTLALSSITAGPAGTLLLLISSENYRNGKETDLYNATQRFYKKLPTNQESKIDNVKDKHIYPVSRFSFAAGKIG